MTRSFPIIHQKRNSKGLEAVVFALLNLIPSVLVRALLHDFLKPAYVTTYLKRGRSLNEDLGETLREQRTKQRQDR
jgi:hypothetical protein